MKKEEVIVWLMIMKANLNSFPPEVRGVRKIEAIAEAIRLLKKVNQGLTKVNQGLNKSEIPTGSTTKNGISNKTIIYKAKESKEIQKDLDKLSELNKTTAKNDLGVDAVSRKAVVEYIKASEADLWHDSENESVIEDILNMPSVTPQEPIRPKGKWISHHCGAYYECSNCHERNNSRYDNYCKFCGAKMEEVEE